MQILRNLYTSFLDTVGLAWWVEIITIQPPCTYYFGPFVSQGEAQSATTGYVEDLDREGAVDIQVRVKQMPTPKILTIDEPGVNGGIDPSQNLNPLVALFLTAPLLVLGLNYIF